MLGDRWSYNLGLCDFQDPQGGSPEQEEGEEKMTVSTATIKSLRCPRCIGGRLFIEQLPRVHGGFVWKCVNCGYQEAVEKKEAKVECK